jgi:signal transduction histidine kinase/DNA-binding response OmpR family regulator/ligand-binding sensor domain-containing protein
MRYLFSFFLVYIVCGVGFAQQLRFDRFDISNGLSQNNIHCMEFDDTGNLWIGTLDGLNRYNGYTFEVIKPSNKLRGKLSGNHIIELGKGISGNMWIVTRQGELNLYNASEERFEIINTQSLGSFNLSQASHIVQPDSSSLWLSSNSTLGFWHLPTSKFETFKAASAIGGIVAIGNKSVLVFGRFGIVKLTVNQTKDTIKLESVQVNAAPCYGLTLEDGKFFALSPTGISQFDLRFNTEVKLIDFSLYHETLPQFQSTSDFVVTEDAFWIGGDGFLCRFFKKSTGYAFQQFNYDPKNDYSFNGHTVTDLRVDEIGNLWIGSFKNGLNLVNRARNQFHHYDWDVQTLSSPESNPIRAICKTSKNELWLGFDRQGLGWLSADGIQKYYSHYFTKNNEKIAITNVRVIFEDSKGTLWVGEEKNLCYFNRIRDRLETIDQLFNFNWPHRCYSIKELEPGIVTLTSPQFIGLFNLHNQTLLRTELEPPYVPVRDFIRDRYNNLWLTKNDNGIVKLNQQLKQIASIKAEPGGLSDNKVYCLLALGDSLWVGTNAGLNVIALKTGKVIRSYFEEDGLCNQIVYSLNADADGYLWMSTNKGISRLNPKTGQFNTYLPKDFFMDDAHFTASNGTIYYGGYTGVVYFQPSTIGTEQTTLTPVIEAFSIFDRQVYPGDTLNGKMLVDQPISATKQIRLHHSQNTFTIRFNAYPFNFPNTIHYRYRLKGLQENWTEATDSRSVTYTKLHPDRYVFEVEASTGLTYSGNSRKLVLQIAPPFWMTWWFKLFTVGSIVLAILLFFKVRMQQIKKRNEWLKQKVDEQTAELREQNRTIRLMSEKLNEANESKLRFFTNISHEFRTPLTLIIGHLDELNTQSKKAIKAIHSNANRLLQLIDQVIDLRKLDQDQMELTVSEFDFIQFVADAVASFELMATKKEIRLQFMPHTNQLKVWLDVDKTEKIIYNLVSNALKFTKEGKHIVITTDETEETFSLRVKDEGIGIEQTELAHIFERFYRTENGQETAKGYGIGLSLVKSLTDMMHGKIVATSEPNKGTTFLLTFNKGKTHFTPDDIKEKTILHKALEINSGETFIIQSKLSGKKILIVEDNHELTEFLVGLLSNDFKLATAENGAEALSQMTKFSPDLIISDIMMPVMNGMDFCKKVKASITTSHIPFILLTAKTDTETQIEGFELGIDDYIEKPFQPKLLLSRIQALLLNREKIKEQYFNSAHTIPVSQHLSGKDSAFLKTIDEVIAKNLQQQTFGVDQLSAMLNMSRATFYRKFTDLTGTSPADYLRRIRLRKAYEHLQKSSLSVDEICDQVGFQSTSNFRKNFKNEFGKSPSEITKK